MKTSVVCSQLTESDKGANWPILTILRPHNGLTMAQQWEAPGRTGQPDKTPLYEVSFLNKFVDQRHCRRSRLSPDLAAGQAGKLYFCSALIALLTLYVH